MLYIGSHTHYNNNDQLLGVVKESLSYNSNAFMFYTGSPQNIKRGSVNPELTILGHNLMRENNILVDNVFIHAPYIINFANNADLNKYNFYLSFFKEEINRVKELGFKNLILHPGSSVKLSKEDALNNLIHALNNVLENESNINILIEFMSGKGSEICSCIDEMAYVINNVNNKECVFVCLDTCHMFDSGIDLNMYDEFLDEFDSKIGKDKIKCIHVNDSLNYLGSHKDRHANIGYGEIGFDTLIKVIYNTRTINIAKILETPKISEGVYPYKYEIECIRNKEFNSFIE